MATRRDKVLDAAIDVLAAHGPRRFTHRAVDERAALPEGSTSNLFRTREGLVAAVMARIAERDLAIWSDVLAARRTIERAELVGALTTLVSLLTNEHRSLTLARRAVSVEAGTQPSAADALDAGRAKLAGWAAPHLRTIGSSDPERDERVLLALLDGLIAAMIANTIDTSDTRHALTAFLAGTDVAPTSARAHLRGPRADTST